MEMRAAAFDHFGGPEVVQIKTVPVPDLEPDEILIEVYMAGVGSWDPDLVSGEFSDTAAKFPRVIGSDGAGTVKAVGDNVRRFEVGDRVYGWGFGNPKGGFFAEYAVVSQDDAAPIPANLSFEEAAVLAVDGITAMNGLDAAGVKKRHAVLIFGSNGGVGHLAVQLAKLSGATVFAVASGDDGVGLAKELGADGAAEGHAGDLVAQIQRAAPKGGFHSALVFAGGEGWKGALEAVKKKGTVAYPHGVEPAPMPPSSVELRGYDGEKSRKAFERLNSLVARGPFRVVISKVFPLEQTSEALRAVQLHHLGKLAIKVH
jgi:NADPH2:quinone reductase